MSTESEQQRPQEPVPGTAGRRSGPPGEQPVGHDEGEGSFRRTFITTQGVFLVFALIAAIPEAPSDGVGAAMQVVIVGCLWFLTDAVALAVKAAHARTMRTRH